MRNEASILLLLLTISTITHLSSSSPHAVEDIVDETEPQQNEESKLTEYRLPANPVPLVYVLKLEPHIDDEIFTFDGTSTITVKLLEETSTITLHAGASLTIDKTYTSLISEDGTIHKPIHHERNEEVEFLIITFEDVLKTGEYSLNLKWKGAEGEGYMGFYRHKDVQESGISRYFATTQFEPLSARSVFPSWDEPAFKAHFDISLKHYGNYTALSNMPTREQIEDENGKLWTHFERSPIMSTYLAVVALSQYVARTNEYGNITLWVPPEKTESTSVILDAIPKFVHALENYTGMPYSLPKLDGAVFSAFLSGATEHWGLISYSDTLLYNAETDTIEQRNEALELAAHEVTHQWLGNIVTPAWWDDIWLSEGLATYLSHIVLDTALPNMHAMDKLIADGNSFLQDRKSKNLRPIRYQPHPKEIIKIFSGITYFKGMSVSRMLHYMVTDAVFRRGIQKYLQYNKYKSVVTNDLWKAVQEAYDESKMEPPLNIQEIMNPWTEQTGYPVVTVTRDKETGVITLSQSNAIDPESDTLWTIPITYATSSSPDFSSTRPTYFLREKSESFTPKQMKEDDWIILNIQQTGHYRFRYDLENWKRIAAYLNTENYDKIHELNRVRLLLEIMILAGQKTEYIEVLLNMIEYLHRETHPLPWIVMTKIIHRLSKCPFRLHRFASFKKFLLHLMNKAVSRFGFESTSDSEDSLVRLARIKLLTWACRLGHEGCRQIAPKKLKDIMEGRTSESYIHENKNWIYSTALADADEKFWKEIMAAYRLNPTDTSIIEYLGVSKKERLIKKYLPEIITDNANLPSLAIIQIFERLAVAPEHTHNFALTFFVNNIAIIKKHLEKEDMESMIARLMGLFIAGSTKPYQLDMIEKLKEQLKLRKIDVSKMTIDGPNDPCLKESSSIFNDIMLKKSQTIKQFMLPAFVRASRS